MSPEQFDPNQDRDDSVMEDIGYKPEDPETTARIRRLNRRPAPDWVGESQRLLAQEKALRDAGREDEADEVGGKRLDLLASYHPDDPTPEDLA